MKGPVEILHLEDNSNDAELILERLLDAAVPCNVTLVRNRSDFLAALEDNPPAAILLTNSQWPQPHGFDAADRWPKFAALLASRYVLDRSKNENGIAWRLYLRRASPV